MADVMRCPVEGYEAKDDEDMKRHIEEMKDDPAHKAVDKSEKGEEEGY